MHLEEDELPTIDITLIPGGVDGDITIQDPKSQTSIDPNTDTNDLSLSQQIIVEFYRPCICPVCLLCK